ncbi:MAG: esterase-like activity of phytase family protein [Chloroherpetonaceae bacterium]|nr:esterase-like activity of phytase family protein [Chloroherpetonaceae bacterium]
MRKMLLHVLVMVFLSGCGTMKTVDLELKQVFLIESTHPVEPSGLEMQDGKLWFVCDKDDSTLYSVTLPKLTDRTYGSEGTARILIEPLYPKEERKFHIYSNGALPEKCDFEGISKSTDGNFYLVSEAQSKIIKVNPKTGETFVLTPDLKPFVKDCGMLVNRNAGLEGIAVVSAKEFLLSAEREVNGIIYVKLDARDSIQKVVGYLIPETKAELKMPRTPDFSDIFIEPVQEKSNDSPAREDVERISQENRIFLLYRGAEGILEMDFKDGKFHEKGLWRFSNWVTHPDFSYQDTTYGLAEGLWMDESHIYVILDNNQDARRNAPQDRRPLLFIFKRPN